MKIKKGVIVNKQENILVESANHWLCEDEIITLSNPEIVNHKVNKSYTWDNRKKFTWVVVSYTGSDNNEYRKSFNFEQGIVNKNGGLDKEKIFSLIPASGKNKEITEISKEPIYI